MSNCSLFLIVMVKEKISCNRQVKIDLIYDTFFNLIIDQGYHNTSTNHIAKSAKISIGTIYNYFPKGKDDIIRSYFEKSMESFLNREDLFNINNTNIRDFLQNFILELYNDHKEKKGYNLAFRSVIQSDKTLHEAHNKKVFNLFKDTAQKLRINNENFKLIPEAKLTEIFIIIFNLLNAIIYHHLSVMEFFDTEEKLTAYLSNIVAFSLNYLNQNPK